MSVQWSRLSLHIVACSFLIQACEPSTLVDAPMADWLVPGEGNLAPDASSSGGSENGDPHDTPSGCISDKSRVDPNRASSLMHPGQACIGCHAQQGGPSFAVAGTVFPAAHEPDDCDAVSGNGIAVVIEDALGHEHTLEPNAAGNFYLAGDLALPYTAQITYQGRTRTMRTPQTNGDCNSCHTGGEAALGRLHND